MTTTTVRGERLAPRSIYYVGLGILLSAAATLSDPRTAADWIADSLLPSVEVRGSAALTPAPESPQVAPASMIAASPAETPESDAGKPVASPAPSTQVSSAALVAGLRARSGEFAPLSVRSPMSSGGVVRQPYLTQLGPNHVVIGWRSVNSTDSVVKYGTVQGSLTSTASAPASVTDHLVTISGLAPNQKYFYQVGDSGGGFTSHAGGSSDHYFVTAPTPGDPGPFRVWAVGDGGNGTSTQLNVMNGMLSAAGAERPDLALYLGDMAYASGSDSEYTVNYFAPYSPVLQNTVMWPTVGNHDGSGTYFSSFVLPAAAEVGGIASGTEAYYSFDYANTHFISLNSFSVSRAANGPMATWLQSDLAASNAQWLVAYWHHPPYSKGTHDSDTETELREMRENILPILEAAGVDLVLTGHSHIYERSYLIDGTYVTPTPSLATLTSQGHIVDGGDGKPTGDGAYSKGAGINAHGGAVYVVAGHGGQGTSSSGTHPVMYFSDLTNGSVLIDISGNELTLRNIRANGTESDTFTIVKAVSCSTSADCTSLNDSCNDGSCNGSGNCVAVPKTNGTPCDDAIACTNNSLGCQAGACSAVDTCVSPQTCNLQTGVCEVPPPPPLPIVEGNSFRYFKGTVEPPATWKNNGFDASSWLQGPSGFGFGDNDDNTVLSDMVSSYASVYVRREFTVPDPAYVASLSLSVDFDDAFVCYLNGTEVNRSTNIAGTPPAFNALASSSHEASGGDSTPLPPQLSSPSPTLLVAGTNVLACQGHNGTLASTDFSLIPLLSATLYPCVVDTDCDSPNGCNAGACVSHVCSTTPSNEGGACDDGSVCTVTDVCASGTCAGSPVTCGAQFCHPATGECVDCVTDANCTGGQVCSPSHICRTPVTVTFQQGAGSPVYAGTVDTFVDATNTTTSNATNVLLTTDFPPPAGDERQILIRFDNIFGSGAGQVPMGATIASASLTVNVSNDFAALEFVRFNRLKRTWSAAETWNTLGASPWNATAGIQVDGVEAVAAADATIQNIVLGFQTVAVTASLQAWLTDPASNFGWVIRSGAADTLGFGSSEVTTVANRPKLSVVYIPPPACTIDADCNDSNVCNGSETCSGSVCQAGTALNCDDGIVCTTDTCNAVTGCGHSNNTIACSDGNACTTGDTCAGGACVPGGATVCNDSNPCTNDSCITPTGCVFTNNSDSCSDGSLCTTGDVCAGGTCSGTPVSCPVGQTCNTGTGTCQSGPTTVVFQQGTNLTGTSTPYTGAVDTYIETGLASQAANTFFKIDASPVDQALLRFDSIFGSGPGQIPVGSTISSATLTVRVNTASSSESANPVAFHRLKLTWSATGVWADYGASPWNTTAGIQTDNVEAFSTADVSSTMSVNGASYDVSVTTSLQAWVGSPASAFGWVIVPPTQDDGLQIQSSEVATVANRPKLTVTYTPPVPCVVNGDCNDSSLCTTDTCNTGNGTCNFTPVSCTLPATCNPLNGQCELPPAPPNQPTNPSPANGATGVALSPQLCVDVSDPNGGTLTVTFKGRVGGGGSGTPFTVIALPDTQFYSQTFTANGLAQMTWIRDNRVARNIVAVTELGDCVNDADQPNQWTNANATHLIIENPTTTGLTDGIPYGVAVGNHDQYRVGAVPPTGHARSGTDENITTTDYNATFPKSRFASRAYHGGNYPLPGFTDSMDNHYELFSGSGMDFIVFHLEWDEGNCSWPADGTPPTGTLNTCQNVLSWVRNILLTVHPNRRAIISTHFLGDPGSTAGNLGLSNQGTAIVNMAKGVPNVFLTLGGHLDQANHRTTSAVVDGHAIYSLVSDFQSRPNGGNGWLRIMTFDPAADTIHVETYSPTVEGGRFINKPTAHADDVKLGGVEVNELTLAYDMDAGLPFQTIGANSSVASGSQTCMSWPGRASNQLYEWKVELSDGASTTTGPMWSFTTLSCTVNGDCNDSDACTTDTCQSGACNHAVVPLCCNTAGQCDDSNPCTTDSCNAGHTCDHVNNSAACNDGSACTTNDTCAGGSCVGGAAPNCDDSNPCTNDSCVPASGCAHANNTASCNDTNACTVSDVCSGGACGGTYAPTAGCCTTNANCNDGNATTTDACSAGNCSNDTSGTCTTNPECDDGDACTTDTCNGANLAALSFDGINDYVSMGAAAGLNASPAFTLEAWINGVAGAGTSTGNEGLSSAIPLVSKGRADAETPANLNMNYFLGISGGKLAGDFEDAATGLNHAVCATTNLPTSGWHHVAATYDVAGGWRLYLDGSALTTTNTNPACSTCTAGNCTTTPGATPEPNSIERFALGSALTAAQPTEAPAGFYAGQMDEVRVWNVSRTQAQIQAAMNQSLTAGSGLIGRWGLNEGSGLTTADSDPNANGAVNGTLTGGTTWVTGAGNLPAIGTGSAEYVIEYAIADAIAGNDAMTPLHQWLMPDAWCNNANSWEGLVFVPDVRYTPAFANIPSGYFLGLCQGNNTYTAFTLDLTSAGGSVATPTQVDPDGDSVFQETPPCGIDLASGCGIDYEWSTGRLWWSSGTAVAVTDTQMNCLAAYTVAGVTDGEGIGVGNGYMALADDQSSSAGVVRYPQPAVPGSAPSGTPFDYGEDDSSAITFSPLNNVWLLIKDSASPKHGYVLSADLSSALADFDFPTQGGANVDSEGVTLTGPNASNFFVSTEQFGACGHAAIVGCCNTAAQCDDGNVCTTDSCVSNACQHVNNTASCTDGNACTGPDVCSGGACTAPYNPTAGCCTTNAQCNDGFAATTDTCSLPAGNCQNVNNGSCTVAAECNDGSACTTDTCQPANISALQFDGTDDYVDFGNAPGLVDFGTGSFTVEGWIYTNGGNADRTGIFRYGQQGAHPQVAVQFTGTAAPYRNLTASIETNSGGQNDTPATAAATLVPVDTWTHFAMVADRSSLPGNPAGQILRLYINGTEVSNVAASTWSTNTINASDIVVIGAARADGGALAAFYDGRIDELRIWNTVRTQAQIQANMNAELTSATGLVHRWGFNAGSGSSAADGVGTSNGALKPTPPGNAPTWVTGGANLPNLGSGTCSNTAIPNCCTSNAQCDDGNACTADSCVSNSCTHTPTNEGGSCTDGNACTQTDTCVSGVCTGSNPVVCTASDQCHDVGTCAPATGSCSNPAKANGTSCSDANACTQTDTCQSGTCTSGSPVVCTALDQCHDAGTCNPLSGCSNPPKANGTACSDGSVCTQSDTCQGGTCTGSNPVICTASDQCHDVGTCNPATGCSNPPKANGSSCTDGNACTQSDTCQTGTCTGSNPVVCTALDQCHVAGTCNTGTGLCSNPEKANGTSCNDASACTAFDACTSGTCGGTPIVCNDGNACTNDSCNPATGCVFANNSAQCNDGNQCTTGETCSGGSCQAGTAVSCPVGQTCNSTNGQCAPTQVTVTFQQNVSGYTGAVDTYINAGAPTTNQGASTPLTVDLLSTVQQALLRFENIFGNGAGQIPPGATINSATLFLYVPTNSTATPVGFYRMKNTWAASATWNTFGAAPWNATAGIQVTDSQEVFTTADVLSSIPTIGGVGNTIAVTPSVQAWAVNPAANFGWVLDVAVDDAVLFESAEAATAAQRPKLTVTYTPAFTCVTSADCVDGNVCTTAACVASACQYNAVPNCCVTDADCYDGNACTSDTCNANQCTFSAIPNCCNVAGDCDDSNQCTTDACNLASQNQAAVSFPTRANTDHVDFALGGGSNANPDYINWFGTSGFTIEGWIYVDASTPSATNASVFRVGESGDHPLIGLQITGLNLTASVEATQSGTDQYDTPAQALPDKTWTHFALVVARDLVTPANQQLRLYLNAGTPATNSAPTLNWNSSPIGSPHGSLLGIARPDPGAGTPAGAPSAAPAAPALVFVGRVDELRIWNAARTQAEIQANMNLEIVSAPGLKHRWNFNAGSGSTAVDTAGGSTATLGGVTTWTTSPLPVVGGKFCSHGNVASGTTCGSSSDTACDNSDTCNGSGSCSANNETNGTSCDDGNPNTSNDLCTNGVCAGTGDPCAGVTCTALDQCHVAGICTAGVCSNPPANNGTSCSDGNACTTGDACDGAGVCTAGTPVTCTTPGECRTAVGATCAPGTGACTYPPVADNTSCADADLCDGAETCQSGVCTAGTPVTCNAPGECRTAVGATCAPGTGACTYPAVADNTSCADADLCDGAETCQSGVCTAGTPVTCNTPGECRTAVGATCAPGTGACTYPAVADNTSCADADLCDGAETCQSGVCTAGTPVTCNTPGECRTAVGATCAPGTGACTYPPVADNTSCADADLCDGAETCQSGVCTAGTPVTCNAPGECRTAVGATCAPGTGACTYPPVADNTSCADADLCDGAETCQSGVCTAGTPVTCNAPGECRTAVGATCAPGTGACTYPPVADNTSCADADLCDGAETCQSGVCTAGTPVTCIAPGECRTAVGATCAPGTGACTYPPVADNTSCADADLCDGAETCQSGVCTAGTAVTCTTPGECRTSVGATCAPGTGACTYPPVADNTSCADADLCDGAETCQSGVCTAGTAVTCNTPGECRTAVGATCAPGTGACTYPAVADSTSCADADLCDGAETCQSGVCTAGTAVTCTTPGECRTSVGATCAPGTGACTYPPVADNTSCADADLCDGAETCQSGVCTAGTAVTCNTPGECRTAVGATCAPGTGACTYPAVADSTSCADADLCDGAETCQSGVCTAGTPVTCNAPGECRTAVGATCAPGTGACTYPPVANNTSCADADLCDGAETCQSGVCTAGTPVTCNTPPGQCYESGGTCSAGTCSYAPKSNGATCNDNNACTTGDVCAGGSCQPGTGTLSCDDSSLCTNDSCVPATGCVYAPINCSDGDGCTYDTCVGAGVCQHAFTCQDHRDDSTTSGGTVSSDPEGDGATPDDQIETAVTTPAGGQVTITEGPTNQSAPSGYDLVNLQSVITATPGTFQAPLVLVFRIDATAVPSGSVLADLTVFRNGVAVPACTGTPGQAVPDPCVSSRVVLGDGDVQITVLTSAASTWNLGVPSCNDANLCSDDAGTPGNCSYVASGACGIGGTVYYYRNSASGGSEPSLKPVPSVGIDETQDAIADVTTGNTGVYSLDDLLGTVAVATVNKYGNPRAADHNGAISSLDASTIARAAVLLITLTPNQVIAGDVTGSGGLSALDASEVARFAVGAVNHFTVSASGSDWKFLRCDSYPGCGAPVYNFNPISQGETGKNFYAVLYGDVTGNWQPAAAFSARSPVGSESSAEELAAIAADRQVADHLASMAPVEAVRRVTGAPAELSLTMPAKTLRAGERRQLTIDLRNADGILGLDLGLKYDAASLRILDVATAGIGSGFTLAHADLPGGTHKISMFGVVPLSGSGSLLTVTVEVLKNMGNKPPLQLSGTANEGGIPIRIQKQKLQVPVTGQ